MLGAAQRCNSCGRRTLTLELRPTGCGSGGLYAYCASCGFTELLWSTSEDPGRLRPVLELFGVAPLALPPCIRNLLSGRGPAGPPAEGGSGV